MSKLLRSLAIGILCLIGVVIAYVFFAWLLGIAILLVMG